jgi:DNA-3-methyladenine glycosylase
MAMAIEGSMSGTSLRDGPIVIRAGTSVADTDVDVTPRVGITQAASWPLRYLVRDDPFVSATPKGFARHSYQR